MKKFLCYLFCTSMLQIAIHSQQDAKVTIRVITDNLQAESKVYITGNDDKLGNWKPNAVELLETDDNIWTKSFSFNKGKKIEFKLTLGNWDSEALNDDGTIPSNQKLEVLKDTTIQINVKLWSDASKKKSAGQITGIVRYHLNMKGESIEPRDVIVWLPPFYFIQPEKRYPVLYMHDGQNIVNPETSFSGIDWQLDEAADSLIRKGLIEDIIIVGIYNTPHRRSEYSENDTGYAYMNFIIDSLKPFIDRNYRTKHDAEFTANGGASLGGLISFILTWEYPEVASKALCFSPALKIDKYDFVDNVKLYKGEKKDIQVYFYNGDDELETKLQTGVDEMICELKNQGFVEGKDFYFYRDQNAMHGEDSWAKNIPRALIYLYGTEKGRKLL